jgi:hypothetical protein
MEKKTFKVPKDRVGYVSKSKTGKSIITVEQDMTLKAGDKLILQKPTEVIDSLVKNGVLSEEVGEQRKSSVPEWKTHEVSKLPPMKN